MVVECLRDLRQVGHVAEVPARFVTFVLQPLGLALGAGGVDVGQRDLGAGLGHAFGIGEADPAGRAGDECRAAADVELVEGLGAFHWIPFELTQFVIPDLIRDPACYACPAPPEKRDPGPSPG